MRLCVDGSVGRVATPFALFSVSREHVFAGNCFERRRERFSLRSSVRLLVLETASFAHFGQRVANVLLNG